MPLTPGTRLGPYEITRPIGAGGMGEVYKARDTRLDRTVAVKVLPEAVSGDPVLRQRFEREARAISALDHPHICALYDVGRENGIDYLVMQHLEGETLDARLERGPLPLLEGLRVGAQIAEALGAAHRRGIVHRDLKPGNVMLTRGGVRLLDFGLARQRVALAASDVTVATPLSGERSIVGTLNYMAPEQLEGREADARTDIFALGLVLYEILTGRRAFTGDSTATVIASILKTDPPPLGSIDPGIPPAVSRTVDRCLAKDPDDRWESANDLAYEMRTLASETPGLAGPPSARTRHLWRIVAGGSVIAAAAALVFGLSRSGERDRADGSIAPAAAEARLVVLPPENHEFDWESADFNPHFALSPDGGQLAFTALDRDGNSQLWIRQLASVASHAVPGTAGARAPFWSPDGKWIAYLSPAGLIRVAVAGGTPQVVSTTPGDMIASWGRGGRILYDGRTFGDARRPLYVVDERGGEAKPVPMPNAPAGERAQRYPAFLPDGRHFIYLSWTVDPAERAIYLGSLDSDTRTLLVRSGFRAVFVQPDILLYIRDGVLVAQRMTLDPPAMAGEPRPIVEGVALEAIPGQATFTASESGVIAYRPRNRGIESELRWVDRGGRPLEVLATGGTDISVDASHDDRRAAVTRLIAGSASDERIPGNIWLLDLSRHVASRFTLEASAVDENPQWSPDGRRIVYAKHRGSGLADLIVQDAIASEGRVLASGVENYHPVDWSADGADVLLQGYRTGAGVDDIDLWVLPIKKGGPPRPFLVAPFSQAQGQFSPDGRWIAYTSDESGRLEVYVRPYPSGDARWQVSSQGGAQPRWRADSRELFYVNPGGTVMSVQVGRGADFTASAPVALFTDAGLRVNNSLFFYGGAHGYDVAADGKRFLVNHLTRVPSGGPMTIVLNAIKQ
jgi:eukaryotic-like serine/threonine-protein kinase